MAYINRPIYLNWLNTWRDKQIIKVITGVRRSGKSTIFHLFIESLKKNGVSDDQIIQLNFEAFENYSLRTPDKLNTFILAHLDPSNKNYIFLDEIQHVENFELIVDSLFIKENVDLYITGSNSYFMSGDLATNLTGRYVSMHVLPLSFKEYSSWRDQTLPSENIFNDYLATAFPFAVQLENTDQQRDYLQGIYSTIVLNDIIDRLKISDGNILERILHYVAENVGSLISANKISGYLTSVGYKTSPATVDRYLAGMADSLILYKAKRYDIRGKSILNTGGKYYLVDLGFRRLMLPDHTGDIGHIIENIVYLELKRRGYDVFVGKDGSLEVDFVAMKNARDKLYIQVSYDTSNEETLKRELFSLQKIHDQYPKILLTMDKIMPEANYDGIIKTSLIEWLKN